MVDYRQVIRTKRMQKGLSQAKLAEMVGSAQAYIYQIESGRKTPSLDLFFAICEALDIRVFPDE